MAALMPQGKQQYFTAGGIPLVGGKVYTYAAGTTTPLATYTTAAAGTPNANPVILDSRGEASIFFSAANYKIVVKDSLDSTIWTQDDLAGDAAATIVANLAASSGASLVGFMPAGVGASARTAQEKFRESVSVLDFYANGVNGVRVDPTGVVDSTLGIQAALTASNSVYFPSGTYLITSVRLKANQFVYGDGAASVIVQSPSAAAIGTTNGAFYADSDSTSGFLDGITIRDLKFLGQVGTLGFTEFLHLVSLNGVSNALVENCDIVGFRGDGLYIGTSATGGIERHNKNVIVRNCFFDGVNKDNRNGLSVIDGNGILIEGNYFTRCTRSNMPGAIDIEPNGEPWLVLKDVKIKNNKFYDIGGNIGVIGVVLPSAVAYPHGFLIEGNYIENSNQAVGFVRFVTGGVLDTTSNLGLKITGNVVKNCNSPFGLFNLKDALIADNSFLSCAAHGGLGYSGVNDNILDTTIRNNLFYACGHTTGNGLVLFKGEHINIIGNSFIDCGTGLGGAANAIGFNSEVTSYINISNNIITSPTGKTLIAIVKEAAATLTPSTNTFMNNVLSGLPNYFAAENSDTIESSYAPVVTGSSVNGVGTYTTTPYGRWRRVGNLVFFRVKIVVDAGHTGTGMIQISLPTLAAAANNNEETICNVEAINVVSTGGHYGLINPALVVGGLGAIRCYMTQTGVQGQILIPAGAFTLHASGFYTAA